MYHLRKLGSSYYEYIYILTTECTAQGANATTLGFSVYLLSVLSYTYGDSNIIYYFVNTLGYN